MSLSGYINFNTFSLGFDRVHYNWGKHVEVRHMVYYVAFALQYNYHANAI